MNDFPIIPSIYIAGAMPKTPSRANMNKVNHPRCLLMPKIWQIILNSLRKQLFYMLLSIFDKYLITILFLPLSKSPKLIFSSRLKNGSEGKSPAPIQEYKTRQNMRNVTTCAIPTNYNGKNNIRCFYTLLHKTIYLIHQ